MSTFEWGRFVLRSPEPITAIRYDGSPECAAAILAMFEDDHARMVEQHPLLLRLSFPDETKEIPVGSWVWPENHGYDLAPCSVASDQPFRARYLAIP